MNKKYIFKGLLFITALLITSCSEDALDKVNEDKNHAHDVSAKFIITDIITSTAFNNVGGDINTYVSVYNEQEVGCHNQLYNAEHRINEPSASSTFNNTWGSLYTALKNARIAIGKCSPGGADYGNSVTKGIAEVLAALNSGIITDMFGDAPWSQAALINEIGLPKYMTPKVDKQEDIYKGIFAYLDSAIIDLQKTDKFQAIGKNDLLYDGDSEKWLKFAYGLKARYTMHTLHKATDKKAVLESVLSYLDKSFSSVEDQAAFSKYDASNFNPTFDFQWSRDGLAASQSMVDKLVERNDPRLRRAYFSYDSWNQLTGVSDKEFNPAPNGTNDQGQGIYTYSIYMYAQTAPTMLMSYHEVLFLKAEALCRLDRADEAKPILKEAIITAIQNTERSVTAAMNAAAVLEYGGLAETTEAISDSETEAFFDNEIASLFEANPLKETMIQKYIAFWGASGEAEETYNDIRRMKALGENFITLANPLNASKYPLRLPYGNDDTTTNPAIKEAYGDGQYVYSTPVWWAGGNR